MILYYNMQLFAAIFMIKSHKSKVSLPYLMLHTFAYLVSALGLCAMYVHKETGKPEGSPFYQYHLYSIHSWTGVLAAALFTLQWLSAAATFIMPCLRSIGLPLGKMFSLYTTILSTISLISGVNQHFLKTLWVWWRYSLTLSTAMWTWDLIMSYYLFFFFFFFLDKDYYICSCILSLWYISFCLIRYLS